MENENVIGKVCFAILRKGFVAGLRISLELDSPGCIIGCKFDGAGIVYLSLRRSFWGETELH